MNNLESFNPFKITQIYHLQLYSDFGPNDLSTLKSSNPENSFIMIYLDTGVISVRADQERTLAEGQLYFDCLKTISKLFRESHNFVVLIIVFEIDQPVKVLDYIGQAYTLSISDDVLLHGLIKENSMLIQLTHQKPAMSYDKEISKLFYAEGMLCYTQLTAILLNFISFQIKKSLPNSITTADPTDRPMDHLLRSLAPPHTESTIDPNILVDKIISYMRKNMDKNLTIEDISRIFLIGSSNLKKIFRKKTGTSIITYFKNMKMRQAQRLVLENQLSYTEIAHQLGYGSLHHFSSSFKNFTGESPSSFYESHHHKKKEFSETDLILNRHPWYT